MVEQSSGFTPEQITAARNAAARALVAGNEQTACDKAQKEEMTPAPSAFDGMLRPAIPMSREMHRLLRAVAIKRARRIPGEQPSIAAVLSEILEQCRPDLEKEAGALYRRELAKKR